MNETTNLKALFSLPYYQRQLIEIEETDFLYGTQEISEYVARRTAVGNLKDMIKSRRVTKLSLSDFNTRHTTYSSFGGMQQLFDELLKGSIGNQELSIEEFEELQKYYTSKKVIQLSQNDTPFLKFPLGHPKPKTIYVCNPHLKNTYYPVKEFHKRTFEHKFQEIITLLMALGATSIKVEYDSGYLKEVDTGLNLNIKTVEVDVKTDHKRKIDNNILYEATFKPREEAKLPEDLVWYHHEPTWQSIAEGRLKHGLLNFNLAINYEEDFNVNSEINIDLIKYGLNINLEVDSFKSTKWIISGDFSEM